MDEGRCETDDKYYHYSYILGYVDDIMVFHHDSLSILKNIDKFFTFKPSYIGDKIYTLVPSLGKSICQMAFGAGA